MQDGWSNTQNQPILASSISDGTKSYLIDVEDCGSAKKTGNYCLQKLEESIKTIKDDYGKEVFAVCTDNEAKMLQMRRSITDLYPNILTYGCNAHYMNLVEGNVVNHEVLAHSNHVNQYYKNHHQLHGMLMEKGGCQPQTANDTRWNSEKEATESFIKNIDIYVEIRNEVYDTNLIDSVTAQKIDNVQLRMEAKHQLKILTKFSVALDRLQSDSCRYFVLHLFLLRKCFFFVFFYSTVIY